MARPFPHMGKDVRAACVMHVVAHLSHSPMSPFSFHRLQKAKFAPYRQHKHTYAGRSGVTLRPLKSARLALPPPALPFTTEYSYSLPLSRSLLLELGEMMAESQEAQPYGLGKRISHQQSNQPLTICVSRLSLAVSRPRSL